MDSSNYKINRWSHKVWEDDGARVEQLGNGSFFPSCLISNSYNMVGQRFNNLEDAMRAARAAKAAHQAKIENEDLVY